MLGRPQLTWSEQNAKRSLGHYDAAHNTIVVSRVFDRPSSPRYAIEYLLYHEMLHLKHPVTDARPAPLRPLPRVQSRRSRLPATERSAGVYQASVGIFSELLGEAFLSSGRNALTIAVRAPHAIATQPRPVRPIPRPTPRTQHSPPTQAPTPTRLSRKGRKFHVSM